MTTDKSYVSVEQAVCPVCGTAHDTGSLLLDMRLKDSMDRATTTHYAPCEEHQKQIDDGYICMVVCDESKSNPSSEDKMEQKDAHRTGEIISIKEKAFTDLFDTPIPEGNICFINEEVAAHLHELAGE